MRSEPRCPPGVEDPQARERGDLAAERGTFPDLVERSFAGGDLLAGLARLDLHQIGPGVGRDQLLVGLGQATLEVGPGPLDGLVNRLLPVGFQDRQVDRRNRWFLELQRLGGLELANPVEQLEIGLR